MSGGWPDRTASRRWATAPPRSAGRSAEHATPSPWQHRARRLGDRLRRVADRRRLGRGGRGRRDGDAARGRRRRRDVLRHRRRVRRRPLGAPGRAPAPGARRRGDHRRHQDGPPPRADRRELLARALPGLERSLAREPRGRHPRPGAAALPADRPLLPPGGVRGSGGDGRRRPDRRLRRQRRARRGGAQGDRVPERGDGSDHLQRVPPAAGGRVLRRGRAPRGRDHRARAARIRPPVGQVHARDRVRRRRPSQLQPPGRGVRRRGDVRGRAVRGRAWTPSRSCVRWCRRARRSRSWRCAGS